MKSFHGVFLVFGSLFLYSSMTCMYVPRKDGGMKPLASKAKLNTTAVVVNQHGQENEQSFMNQGKNEKGGLLAKERQDFWNFLSFKNNPQEKANVVVEHSDLVEMPKYTRGIYLSNNMGRSKARLLAYIKQAKAYNINTFVIDVQPRIISKEHVKLVRQAGIFPVARIVVFHGGLKTSVTSPAHINRRLRTLALSAQAGFLEAQLDYIRYADYKALRRLSLKHKYAVIEGILAKAKAVADRYKIKLSADLFGRITLNQHDHIGQRLELFAKYVDVIYPMVYPSHYTNDNYRISKPYFTVKEGVEKSKKRIKNARIVAYIQGFKMKIGPSGLSMSEYIRKQMRACEDAGGDGWVIWNPRNQYAPSYAAIRRDSALKDKYAYKETETTVEPKLNQVPDNNLIEPSLDDINHVEPCMAEGGCKTPAAVMPYKKPASKI